MLTQDELVELDLLLEHQKVLTVYLDGAQSDPAERTSWRRSLALSLGQLRESLHDRSHAEREAFDASVARLEDRLAGIAGFLPDVGWAAFVTPDGARYAEALPVQMPTLVTWQEGLRIAPYLRALEQRRFAIVAVMDARMVRLFRYRLGTLEPLEVHRAHIHTGPVTHMGHPPRSGFHSGTRGMTGTDQAERERRIGRERMLREAGERIVALSAPDAWVLLGGIAQVTAEALAVLPDDIRARAHRVTRLDVHATDARIASVAERRTTQLRAEAAAAVVDEVVALSGNAANGVTGDAPTREALRGGAVDRLVLTEQYLHEHAAEADGAIRAALAQHADVALVNGAAGERLDAMAGGIGARLRYVPWTPSRPVPTLAAR